MAAFMFGAVLYWVYWSRLAGLIGAVTKSVVPAAVVTCFTFFLLSLFCVSADSPAIQSGVADGAARRIGSIPIPGVSVSAAGRDLVLTGTVASATLKAQAGQTAAASSGVRGVDNRIAVAPAVQTVQSQTLQSRIEKILLSKKIEFEPDVNVLLPESIPVLEEVLKVLDQSPGLSVRIDGYTDSLGNPEVNRALSLARAQAVLKWLADHGVDKNRMTASGFGPDKPVAPNKTAAGRSANRRVEITTN